MQFTQRGLIHKTPTTYCKTWEDLFMIEGRDTKDKQKRFKARYKCDIAQVTYSSGRGTETVMVASQRLAENIEESDLQKIARGELITDVESNRDKSKRLLIQKDMPIILREIDDILRTITQNKLCVVDEMVVDIETGEVIRDNKYLTETSIEFRDKGATNDEIAWSIAHIDVMFKYTGKMTRFISGVDEDGNKFTLVAGTK